MMQTPTLNTLLKNLGTVSQEHQNIAVHGLASHSDKVHSGDLYLALRGHHVHGLDFLKEAIERGAVASVWEHHTERVPEQHEIPLIPIDDLQHKVGIIAHRFFNAPSQQMQVIAATGTNGKTTTTHFIAEILHALYAGCGVIGTLGWGCWGALKQGSNTTPEALQMHQHMHALHQQGMSHVVLEASSEGLVQGRLAGVEVDVAVLTQIGRDHFDYHKSEKAYLAAKELLFQFPHLRYTVINIDCNFGVALLQKLSADCQPITYSAQGNTADISAHNIQVHAQGLQFDLKYEGQSFVLNSALLGQLNVSNLLATFAVLMTQGVEAEQAVARLANLQVVPGRMQRFGGQHGQPIVLVDYAHTADALEAVLATVADMMAGECHCVFGCGGQRDPGKRKLMGMVAEQYAQHIVLTDDNPRQESAQQIVRDILEGIKEPGKHKIIHDRGEAIRYAIAHAGAKDCVVVAGKGHETEQWIGTIAYPFSDAKTIQKALLERG